MSIVHTVVTIDSLIEERDSLRRKVNQLRGELAHLRAQLSWMAYRS
jgi:uncharacterized coiled-coil DUF342 family protein